MKLSLATILCAGQLLAMTTSRGPEWPRWRGPDGTGISKETEWDPQALAKGPKVKWKVNVGEGHSCVSIADKRLYTLGNKNNVDVIYCVDAETGKEVWHHTYPSKKGNYPGPRSTPALDGDFVYTMSRDGLALCLDAKTGKVKWQVDLLSEHGGSHITWGLAGSPLVVGDAVFYNAGASGVALNKATGKKIWASGGGKGGYATPVFFKNKDRECLAIFSSKDVFVVDAKTGEKLLDHRWETSYDVNAPDPLFFDGKLFITSGYNRGCALLDLSGAGARTVWENQNLSCHFSSPIYLDGHIYGVDGNTGTGQLRCLDAKTGEVKWSERGGFENLMIAGGKILAIDKKGELKIAEADPSGYKEIAQATVLSRRAQNWTAPVLCNGLIYCRNSKGDLVCIDVR
ncbi:MAG: PQQ-binding-like beta-propeller repeat protein [Planctomycetes bacterium]|nr:PQQ-binding-like beta-propeller repeat protein [Planctomycetota bacterium]